MNKKIFTRIISFVLVVCLLLPVIPNLGLDLSGVIADASYDTSSNTVYFKSGTKNYLKAGTVGSGTNDVITRDGVVYIPTATLSTALSITPSTTYNGDDIGGVSGVTYAKIEHGATVSGSYKAYITDANLVIVSSVTTDVSNITADEQQSIIKSFAMDHLLAGGVTITENNATRRQYTATVTGNITAGSVQGSHPYLLANKGQFEAFASAYDKTEGDEGYDPILKNYLTSVLENAANVYSGYGTELKEEDEDGNVKVVGVEINTQVGLVEAKDNIKAQGALYNMPYYKSLDGSSLSTLSDGSTTMNGYDAGGRQNESSGHASRIASLAFAYQVLKHSSDSDNQELAYRYAKLAFEYAACLSNWEHWGAGHFLNAADASYYMALAYDWCYDAWSEDTGTYSYAIPTIEGDVTTRFTSATYDYTDIRDALFIKGVYAGLVSALTSGDDYCSSSFYTTSVFCPWYNNQLGGYGSSFTDMEANWNAVCTSGLTMAALALLNDDGGFTGLSYTWINSSGTAAETTANLSYIPAYFNGNISSYNGLANNQGSRNYIKIGETTFGGASAFLLNTILYTLESNGLDIYGAYGDYRESLSYWNYGTGSLFALIAALETTLGDDYGLSAAAGLDNTAYFSYYAQSGDGLPWKYGDDSYGSKAETPVNGLFGAILGDDNIVSYRKYLISTGAATPTYYDLFRYDASIGEEDFKEMSLDYHFKGIQGFSTRDSWQPGSMYVAFGGGDQQASHAQLDSGAFVYYNNGVKWFEDLGAENYNITGGYHYGQEDSDYQYYRSTSEGNNCLVQSSLTYGQNSTGVTTTIEKVKEGGAYGSYAILDQTAAYSNVTSAKRGILTTNDRRTVVIQDEVQLSSGTDTFYWIGHLSKDKIITFSDDNRIAYITDGNTTIRCTIVSDNANLKFERYDIVNADGTCYNVLGGTPETLPEGTNDLTGYQRLEIMAAGVSSLKLAVVIEEIMPGDDAHTNYEWKDMGSWDSAIVNDDRSYDKVLLDKNFDVEGIGSFTSQSGNIKLLNTKVDGDNAMGFYSNDSIGAASSLILTAAPSRVELANLGKGMLVAEFDVATLDKIPENLMFGIYGSDTVHPIVGGYLGDSSLFGDFDRDFTHITIVLDEDNDMFYLFSGNTCVKAEKFTSKSYAGLSVRFTTDNNTVGGQPDGTALIDNVVVRCFTERYTGLDSYLTSAVVGSDSGILGWADKTGDGTQSANISAVAEIYNIKDTAVDADKDSPVIDLWGWGAVTASETQAQADVEVPEGRTVVKTFDELEKLINSGLYTNVELYRSNTEVLNITIATGLSVDTKGYNFIARATQMVCNVNGDIYEYSVGTLDVTFVINGTSYSATVTSSDYAYYEDLDSSVLGGITPKDNGDGTVTFYVRDKGAWSLVDGGEVVHGADLIVTSENNKFYLASETVYDGLYVIKNGSTYTAGGSTVEDLKSDINSSHSKIILTSDVVLTQTDDAVTVNFHIGNDKNVTLDLNGFTITYTGAIGAHLFVPGYRTTLEVNGPGNIVNLSPQNAVVYMSQVDKLENSAAVEFNNVNVSATQNFIQMRSGTTVLNNCTINSLDGQTLFNIGSEGGGHWENTTNTDFTVNGGVINFIGNRNEQNVLRLLGNGTATLMGGVAINTPEGESAIAVAKGLNSAKNGHTVNGYKLRLGEVYFSNPNFFYDTAYQTADNVEGGKSADGLCEYITLATLKSEGKFKYIEGAVFTDAEVNSEKAYLDTGYWYARTGDVGYPWKVVLAADAIQVTFKDGDTTFVEDWVVGAIPSILGEAREYLDGKNSSAAGTKYTYDMSVLAGGGVAKGTSYTFNITEAPNATLRMSISLYSEFVVNILFQTTGIGGSGTVDYSLIKVDGVAFTPDQFKKGTVNGDEYVYVSVKLKADEASKVIGIYAEGTDNNGNACKITTATSIVKYASNVIGASGTTDTSKQLMKSIISYIGATAGFVDDRFTEASCNEVLASETIAGIKTPDTAIGNVAADVENTKNIANAVSSAQIALGKSPNFVFNFNKNYSGTVKFTYTTNMSGRNIVTAVTVVNGNITKIVADGKEVEGASGTSYQLDMRTFDMAENIAISVDGAAAVNYNLDVYYVKAVQDTDALYDLIIALKSYCMASKEYRNAN